MRGIIGLLFSMGLGIFLAGTNVAAQDATKPIAIQVVIGATAASR